MSHLNGFTGGRAPGSGDPFGLGPRTVGGADSTPALVNTSQVNGTGRCRYTITSGTTGRRSSGSSRYFRGNAANRGGFRLEAGVNLGVNSSSTRMFVGYAGVDSFLTEGGNPSGQGSVPMVGIGFDDTSGTGDNLLLFHCDGGGSVTSVDTGLVRSIGQVTHIRISCEPNTSSILVELQRRENTGSISSASYVLSSNIPANTALLYSQLSVRGNGGANSGQLDVAYCEFRGLTVLGLAPFDSSFVYHGWWGRGADTGSQGQWGLNAPINSGTPGVGALSTADHLSSRPRITRETSTGTQTAGWRQAAQGRVWRGDSAGEGGFDVTTEFGYPSQAFGSRAFCGLNDQNAAFLLDGSVDPGLSTARHMLGVGWDAGDSAGGNFKLYHNDGLAGVTEIDTGIVRAVGSIYRLRLECAPNESEIRVSFDDLTTGTSYATTVSSNMPGAGTFLSPQLCIQGVTGAIVAALGEWHRRVV